MLMKTDAVPGAKVESNRNFRWLIPVVFGLLIAIPVIAAVVARYPTFDFLTELTVYRIGNAISLLSGEKQYILPVQGLPVALLAKLEIWAIGLARSTFVMNVATLHLYLGIFFGTLFALATATLAWSWSMLTGPQRAAAVLLMACPWVLGGASMGLLLEPDYWAGEWCYLAISFCLLAIVKQNRDYRYMPVLVGAWLAVGMAMKITLLGVALLFLIALGDRRPKTLAMIAASFILAYIAMAVVYMGGLSSTMRLLAFQLKFFAHPNDSAQWANAFTEIMSRPFLLFLAAAFSFALVTSSETRMVRGASLLWVAGLTYLLWRRPHDTSIASAATALTFLTVYFIRTRSALIVVSGLLVAGAAADGFSRERSFYTVITAQYDPSPVPKIYGMIYQPDNYWNAGFAVQAFGYNGELGFYYPIENAPDGSPRYSAGGKAFQSLFPGVVMIADSPPTLDVAERALKSGVPIWWTRQDPVQANSTPGSLDRINAIIKQAGAEVETFPITVDGHPWLLQKAVRKRL